MNVEICIDENCSQPRMVIYTREITPEIAELVTRLSDMQPAYVIGYQDDKLEILPPETILRVYADQQKVFAQTESGIFTLRHRLYEVEEMIRQPYFIRISNSEIVNFKKVRQLDLSLAGTICLYFYSGQKSFVSRRYMQKIKAYLGL